MATQVIKLVEDNTAPDYTFTLTRNGTAIDLTNSTVDLILSKGNTITNTGHQGCALITPASGIVAYTPEAGDFASPGTYKADLKITYADATVETLYEQAKFKVRRRLQ